MVYDGITIPEAIVNNDWLPYGLMKSIVPVLRLADTDWLPPLSARELTFEVNHVILDPANYSTMEVSRIFKGTP